MNVTAEDLAPSMTYFPLVGLLLGAIVVAFDVAMPDSASPILMGAMECGLLAFLTRGLHLDGLADTADGLLSSRPRKEALAIMRDSATGALGALTLMVILLLKSASFSQLSESHKMSAMLLAPMCSRWSLVVLAALCPYARPEGGLGQYFTGAPARRHLGMGFAISLGASSMVAGLWGIFFVGLSSVIGWIASLWFKKRLGGVTGDCLGAHLEVSETLFLIVSALYM